MAVVAFRDPNGNLTIAKLNRNTKHTHHLLSEMMVNRLPKCAMSSALMQGYCSLAYTKHDLNIFACIFLFILSGSGFTAIFATERIYSRHP